jgi:hypothetical protein
MALAWRSRVLSSPSRLRRMRGQRLMMDEISGGRSGNVPASARTRPDPTRAEIAGHADTDRPDRLALGAERPVS